MSAKPPLEIPGSNIRAEDDEETGKQRCPRCKRNVRPTLAYNSMTGNAHWVCPYCDYHFS